MQLRFGLYAVLATLGVGGVAMVADALSVSDEEQLEQLADELTEANPHERIDGVLRWMDLSRQAVEVRTADRTRTFAEDADYALSTEVAEAIAPFEAADLDVVQRSVQVRGDRGTVAVRARADGRVHDVTFRLVRSGQGWLVTDLRAR